MSTPSLDWRDDSVLGLEGGRCFSCSLGWREGEREGGREAGTVRGGADEKKQVWKGGKEGGKEGGREGGREGEGRTDKLLMTSCGP